MAMGISVFHPHQAFGVGAKVVAAWCLFLGFVAPAAAGPSPAETRQLANIDQFIQQKIPDYEPAERGSVLLKIRVQEKATQQPVDHAEVRLEISASQPTIATTNNAGESRALIPLYDSIPISINAPNYKAHRARILITSEQQEWLIVNLEPQQSPANSDLR